MLCLEDALPFRAYAVAETLGLVVNFGLRKPQGSLLILTKDREASHRSRHIALPFANKRVVPSLHRPKQTHGSALRQQARASPLSAGP